jgi:hypothetical protein
MLSGLSSMSVLDGLAAETDNDKAKAAKAGRFL